MAGSFRLGARSLCGSPTISAKPDFIGVGPWTPTDKTCHRCPMTDDILRDGEVAAALPAHPDAGVYFIGTIRTPWHQREDCPKRGNLDGPICTIVLDERWRQALTGLMEHPRIQVLYWMHHAR